MIRGRESGSVAISRPMHWSLTDFVPRPQDAGSDLVAARARGRSACRAGCQFAQLRVGHDGFPAPEEAAAGQLRGPRRASAGQ